MTDDCRPHRKFAVHFFSLIGRVGCWILPRGVEWFTVSKAFDRSNATRTSLSQGRFLLSSSSYDGKCCGGTVHATEAMMMSSFPSPHRLDSVLISTNNVALICFSVGKIHIKNGIK